jgi:hypothetical protein
MQNRKWKRKPLKKKFLNKNRTNGIDLNRIKQRIKRKVLFFKSNKEIENYKN